MSDSAKEKAWARQAKQRAELKQLKTATKTTLKGLQCTWKSSLSPMELKEHKLKERMWQKSSKSLFHVLSFTLCSSSSIGLRELLSRAKAAPIARGGPSTSAGSTPYHTTRAIGKAVKNSAIILACIPK